MLEKFATWWPGGPGEASGRVLRQPAADRPVDPSAGVPGGLAKRAG